jgi:hypothetical protein
MMRPALVLLPLALTALAGCGAESGSVEARPSAAPAGSASAKPGASTSPGLGIQPAAPDGDDLDACSDGRCEVKVKEGDKITFKSTSPGFDGLKVDKIADGRVSLVGNGPGIRLGGEVAAGKSSTLNNLKVTVVVIRDATAILRLGPK